MGHQVNFYLAPEDLRDLERRLREIQPLTVIHRRSPSDQPRVVDSFEVLEDGKPWFFLACVRTEDLAHVTLRHVPEQGYWVVDEYQSPVIELTRCFFDGRILRSGRLYYNDGFWGPDKTWVEKPEPFRKWAKSGAKVVGNGKPGFPGGTVIPPTQVDIIRP
jgi:hypothetical protein